MCAEQSIEGLARQLSESIEKECKCIAAQADSVAKARQDLEAEKEKMMKLGVADGDILTINVGGRLLTEKRSTFLLAPENTLLHAMFSGRWDNTFERDSNGAIFFSFTPVLFERILSHLRTVRLAPPDMVLRPPIIDEAYVQEFKVLVDYLGLQEFLYRGAHKISIALRCPIASDNMSISGEENSVATHGCHGTGHIGVVGVDALPHTSVWKVTVHALQANNWVFFGVIGSANPNNTSYADATSYGWGCGGQVYVAGSNKPQHGGWTAWSAGDSAVMKLDVGRGALKMYHQRLRATFQLTGLPENSEWWLHANLHGSNDCVKFSRASQEERDSVEH